MLNEVQRYIVEEHIEDFRDGLITRRELLRRVTFITGSLAASFGVLATLGCDVRQPAAPPAPTPAGAATPAPSPTPAATAAPPTPAVSYALPPAERTTDGITVKPDDPRILAQTVDVKATDGAALSGYLARPKPDGRYPGVVVVQENRGLVEHIKDVTRRLATAGFAAISVDLLSREGGAEKLGDAYPGQLGRRSVDDMVKDLGAALDHLKSQPFVASDRLAAIGFCFGGGMVWSLLDAAAPLRAAVPYYGPTPSKNAGIARTKAAVLGVYAGNDTRVNAGRPTVEDLLKTAGTTFKLETYAGVDHAFNNDTGPRYDPTQARRAWVDTVEWLRKHLAS